MVKVIGKLSSWFEQTVRRWLIRKTSSRTQQEHEKKILTVGGVIYEHLIPILQSIGHPAGAQHDSLVTIEGGAVNYFAFKDGSLPRFDFMCPQVHLYVYIGSPLTSSLPYALDLGYTVEEWESAHEKLTYIQSALPVLTQVGTASEVKVLTLSWEEPCSTAYIVAKLQKLFSYES
jgi:hypothetical protein